MRPAAIYSTRLLAGRIAALYAGAVLSWTTCGAALVPDETTAKIQFLHYVAQYAVWPKEAFSSEDPQFIIGVLGESPFGDALDRYFKGKLVKGRQIVIKYCKNVQEARGCQLLFISASLKSSFGEIVDKLEDAAVLTVSDGDGFIQKNGMIHIFLIAKSEITTGLAWAINPSAIKKAGLHIDPFFIEKARKPPS